MAFFRKDEADSSPEPKRFIRLVMEESSDGGYCEVWADRQTGVQYFVRETLDGCGVTPLLDREGKVLWTDPTFLPSKDV